MESCEHLAPHVARITSKGEDLVVKKGSRTALRGEVAGLEAIREATSLFKVPKVIALKDQLEYLKRDADVPWYLLGRALAALHLAAPKDPQAEEIHR
eukprot:Skav210279  [mRNA]  locus=scaffold2977:230624:231537:- [translate_table: standard]